MRSMRWWLAVGVALGLAAGGVVRAPESRADVFCKKKKGAVLVRPGSACKGGETLLDLSAFGAKGDTKSARAEQKLWLQGLEKVPAEATFHNNKVSDVAMLMSAMVDGELFDANRVQPRRDRHALFPVRPLTPVAERDLAS